MFKMHFGLFTISCSNEALPSSYIPVFHKTQRGLYHPTFQELRVQYLALMFLEVQYKGTINSTSKIGDPD